MPVLREYNQGTRKPAFRRQRGGSHLQPQYLEGWLRHKDCFKLKAILG